MVSQTSGALRRGISLERVRSLLQEAESLVIRIPAEMKYLSTAISTAEAWLRAHSRVLHCMDVDYSSIPEPGVNEDSQKDVDSSEPRIVTADSDNNYNTDVTDFNPAIDLIQDDKADQKITLSELTSVMASAASIIVEVPEIR